MAFETDSLGFSPDWDVPVRYIDRTHAWYDALGTNNHYRYASFQDVPFTALRKPLSQCRVALLTTAAPFDPSKGQQDCKAPYNAAAKFYKAYSGDTAVDHDLRVSHVGIDRRQLTDDANCWFPLPALRRAAAAGLKASEFLDRNDAYNFFRPLGDLVVPGPTFTNVNDFRALLVL